MRRTTAVALFFAALVSAACESSTAAVTNPQRPRSTLAGLVAHIDTIETGTSLIIRFSDGNELQFVSTGQGVIVAGKAQGTVSNLAFASDGQASIGATSFLASTSALGFFDTSGQVVKQTVTGSRGNNAALSQLLAKLHNLGLITNNTTN